MNPDAIALLKAGLPVITFVLGFITSRFTYSKKEKSDVTRAAYNEAKALMERQEQTYRIYIDTISSYHDCKKDEEFDYFTRIAGNGETYFYQMKIVADAILSENVDRTIRDTTFIPNLKRAINEILPSHYDFLRHVADRKGFKYSGALRRENYESLYLAVERYGSNPSQRRLVDRFRRP